MYIAFNFWNLRARLVGVTTQSFIKTSGTLTRHDFSLIYLSKLVLAPIAVLSWVQTKYQHTLQRELFEPLPAIISRQATVKVLGPK